MSSFVVDENVLVVANDVARVDSGKDPNCPQADEDCRIAAVQALNDIARNRIVVVDDIGAVISLYRNRMSGSGQPGSGDAFFRYVFDNQYNARRVLIAHVNEEPERGFEEFPADEALRTFDWDDRIYVSLCVVVDDACLVNAVDSDYQLHRVSLRANGVEVMELCPNCLKDG